MSSWDGVFRCEKLGVADCVVWWDAIAAVGAIAGVAATFAAVVATVVLGVLTYQLGVAANRASNAALKLAGHEDERQRTRALREQTLVLVQINGEVIDNQRQLADIRKLLAGEIAGTLFEVDDIYRPAMLRRLADVNFPLTDQLADRLHYLDDPIGPALVRCIAMLRTLVKDGVAINDGRDRAESRKHYQTLCLATQVMFEDLESVRLACANAIAKSGIDAARIAALDAATSDSSVAGGDDESPAGAVAD